MTTYSYRYLKRRLKDVEPGPPPYEAKWMTVLQAAKATGYSRTTLYNRIFLSQCDFYRDEEGVLRVNVRQVK